MYMSRGPRTQGQPHKQSMMGVKARINIGAAILGQLPLAL